MPVAVRAPGQRVPQDVLELQSFMHAVHERTGIVPEPNAYALALAMQGVLRVISAPEAGSEAEAALRQRMPGMVERARLARESGKALDLSNPETADGITDDLWRIESSVFRLGTIHKANEALHHHRTPGPDGVNADRTLETYARRGRPDFLDWNPWRVWARKRTRQYLTSVLFGPQIKQK